MRLPPRRPFVERAAGGTFVLALDEDLAALLRQLAGQLHPILEDPAADPGLQRLFPPAYPEDVLAEAAWQIQQGPRLRDARREALAALDQPPGATLTEEELVAWIQGVNALRLVLAERLVVDSDPDREELAVQAAAEAAESRDPVEAQAGREVLQAWAIYEHLGMLVGDAVDALDAGP